MGAPGASLVVPISNPGRWLRLVVAFSLGAYGLIRLRNPEYWDLLDDVNLAIHEAGHLVFSPLGDHPGVIGGSLFQVLVPVAFVVYFGRRRDWFAASVVTAWVGTNLTNVAIYIGDSRAQDLPLLGGENAVHDWWYLLTEWDLITHDIAIARCTRLAGALMFAVAVAGAARAQTRNAERERSRPRCSVAGQHFRSK